jgi:2-oxo-4-hydroxy-4-carboxy-5-ureidoimidazoline decarboxylase
VDHRPLTIAVLNDLDQSAFVARLGHLYEGSPWVAADTWPHRPFASLSDLHQQLTRTVADAGRPRHLDLIRAHPDLVGAAALAGTLGPASTAEQTAADLGRDHLTAAQIERFAALNRAYHERFGFPFVICAREHKQAAILAGFETRLPHDEEQEIATALAEIAKIAWYRLLDVVADDAAPTIHAEGPRRDG